MSDVVALRFRCEGESLQAMLHVPQAPGPTGVLVVVGGPQYRVGSHRQFVLLARSLAAAGIPVLRFDYRGLGDSTGAARSFEAIDADIAAAVDEFVRRVPQLVRVVIWGLCDAASAALFYAARDPRIGGLVLLNPWVRSEQSVARAYLRHYYLRRLVEAAAWREVLAGRKSPGELLRSFLGTLGAALRRRRPATDGAVRAAAAPLPLPERMRRGLAAFHGPVLLVLSGDDITAAEFRSVTAASRGWRRLLQAPRVTTCELPAADHTFSTHAWRDQVATWTAGWIERHWPGARTADAHQGRSAAASRVPA